MWNNKYKKISLNDEAEEEELDPFSLDSNRSRCASPEPTNTEINKKKTSDRVPLLSNRTRSYLESTSDSTLFSDSYDTGDLTTSSLISHPLQPEYESVSCKEVEEGEVGRNCDGLDNLVGSSSSSLPSLSSSPTHQEVTFSQPEFLLPPLPVAQLPQPVRNQPKDSRFTNFNLFSRLNPWSMKRPTTVVANDGVFFNLNAKPALMQSPSLSPTSDPTTVNSDPEGEFNLEARNGGEFISDTNELPNYRQALDEPSPPSFDLHNVLPSWAHPRSRFLDHDDMEDPTIDGLPLGSLVVFVITLFFSSLLQFIGFILTYLVHTDHAGRLGSLAGLGVTFLQIGYGLRNNILEVQLGSQNFHLLTSDTFVLDPTYAGTAPAVLIISYTLMTLGWFNFLYGITTFLRYSKLRYEVNTSPPTITSRQLV